MVWYGMDIEGVDMDMVLTDAWYGMINRFYEEHGDLDNARVILNKATLSDFRVCVYVKVVVCQCDVL